MEKDKDFRGKSIMGKGSTDDEKEVCILLCDLR